MAYTIIPVTSESVWESFLLAHNPAALFQSWIWGEVQKKAGHTVSRHGVFDGKKLAGIFQTVDVRARRGSFLHVRHGPVLADTDIRVWKQTCAFLKDEARRKHMVFVRMNPLIADTTENRTRFTALGMQPAAIHRMDGEHCWVLTLSQTEDAILAGMRKTTRYEIRRAEKEGVSVRITTAPSDLDAFFSLYRATSDRHGFIPHQGIREEFELFAKNNSAVLYLGSHAGTVIAGAIVLYYGGQAIYHHGASQHSRVPVSHGVQWLAIRDAKKRGMKTYNFWGIAPDNAPNHPWNGITVFKKGFGGSDRTYLHAHDLPVSPLYVIPRLIETIRRVRRGYD